MLPARISTAETEAGRFLSFVEVRGDCWLWDGAKTSSGYGHHCWQGKHVRAHRVAYELFNGPISGGLHVLHACDVRNCVNPAHLRLGTHLENMREMVAKGRHVAPRGVNAPSAKLTVDQVQEIRATREPAHQVAPIYGVSKSLIWAIRSRKVWKHLP
jgi:hypothetical protein